MRHRPTGIKVFINGRKQNQNKKEARRILESRVKAHFQAIDSADRNKNKTEQIGNMKRSGKVRTYNFIDKRVTDHRLGTKTSKIKQVMKGQFELLWK